MSTLADCHALFLADTVPALMALGAKIKISSLAGDRVVDIEQLYTGVGETPISLGSDEIVAEVQLPKQPSHTGGVYLKHSLREAINYAVVSAAAVITIEPNRGTCSEAKIALGGMSRAPVRASKAEEVIRGMRETASKGYFCGGKVPYGYKAVKVMDEHASRTKLESDRTTTPIVKRIFGECLQGNGVTEIAKGLNRDGIPSSGGKKWYKNNVYEIVTNEVVTGTLVWGKRGKRKDGFPIRVDKAWTPIVDKETFIRAQSILALRSPKVTHPRSVTSEYLLGGMMKCAKCGASMTGSAAKSGKFFYYRCANALRRGPEACPGRWLPKDKIEGFVIDKIKDYILTDENLGELVRLTNEEIDALTDGESEKVKMLDGQIRNVDFRLERLYDALETGKLAINELAPRISSLVSRKAELQRARQEAQNVLQEKKLEIEDLQVMRDYVQDLKSVLGSASIIEQKAFLKSFVRSVDVSNSQVTVNYTLPIPPLNADKETVGVLAFTRSGRPYRSRTCDTLIKRQRSSVPLNPPHSRGVPSSPDLEPHFVPDNPDSPIRSP